MILWRVGQRFHDWRRPLPDFSKSVVWRPGWVEDGGLDTRPLITGVTGWPKRGVVRGRSR